MHLVPVGVPEGIALLIPGSYRICIEKSEPQGRVCKRMVSQHNFVSFSVGAVKILVIQGPYNGILSYIGILIVEGVITLFLVPADLEKPQ